MQLFYSPGIEGENYILNPEESYHCTKVLRLKNGDPLFLTDGIGNLYSAVIDRIDFKKTAVKITDIRKEYSKRNYRLHIAIAPPKNIERFEWFLEKSTEIGIDEITPVLTEHSERSVIKPERLERIIIAAMKQSLKAYKPILNPLQKFSDFIQNTNTDTEKFIAYCGEGERKLLKASYNPGRNVLLLIGPEGDFTKVEVELASHHNFKIISLGDSRLRTETAGIVACNSINLLNQ